MRKTNLSAAQALVTKAGHDLDSAVVLLDECKNFTTEFEIYRDALASFSPYAVQLRYEIDFTPDEDEAKRAHTITLALRDTLSRLTPETFTKNT